MTAFDGEEEEVMTDRISHLRRAGEMIAKIQRQTEPATEEEVRSAVDASAAPSSDVVHTVSSASVILRYEFEMSRGETRSESALTRTAS